MQIVPFLTHYQFVYVNIDIPSFSVISYIVISRLLEAKRPRFDFELYENSLQISNEKEISCLQKIDIHGINLYFTLQFILLCESNRYKKVISCKCITLYSIHNQ